MEIQEEIHHFSWLGGGGGGSRSETKKLPVPVLKGKNIAQI